MTRTEQDPGEKPLFWTGSSKNDLLAFPERLSMKLDRSQRCTVWGKAPKRDPGEGKDRRLEVVETNRCRPYRAVYTVKIGVLSRAPCVPKEVPSG